MTNLRERIGEGSDLRDLARAIETPFVFDAYDLGVAGAIAYCKTSIEQYKKSWAEEDGIALQKFALHSESVPEAIFLRQMQFAMPRTERKVAKVLGRLAEMNLDATCSYDDYWKVKDLLFSDGHLKETLIKYGRETARSLSAQKDIFTEDEDKYKFKPVWVSDADWRPTNGAYGIRGEIFHCFGNSWDQRIGPHFRMRDGR